MDEAKKFFAFVMDLDFKEHDDRDTFKNIMRAIDIESR
jgi:hypothetical protein